MAQDAPSIGEPGQAAKPERGKSVRLVDRVFDQLRERIRSGNYAPDSRLPGEHELASIMGVSRPIVRDALGRLREEGMVYSRQGAGTFVSAQASPATHLAYSPVKTIADIQRCYEFRLTIEPAAAFSPPRGATKPPSRRLPRPLPTCARRRAISFIAPTRISCSTDASPKRPTITTIRPRSRPSNRTSLSACTCMAYR